MVSINIHNVTSLSFPEPEKLDETNATTRTLTIKTTDSGTFELTLFTDTVNAESLITNQEK